ncbi:hypothetical protein [Lactococcus lactis]|uniref:hypothetical protein n=1 Tax=Lactococcus lactis TaxID=1358 RepID=UPI00288E479B|nr:hypothetical protein [Lactococcus lactis]MDT2909316.1 hypothetical protein [Lactococcus lactis]MDT2925154.1 hypothetical protein [Lactococcus lactis]MDT2952013.1 hypothetical protein [Lactococcus lactis]
MMDFYCNACQKAFSAVYNKECPFCAKSECVSRINVNLDSTEKMLRAKDLSYFLGWFKRRQAFKDYPKGVVTDMEVSNYFLDEFWGTFEIPVNNETTPVEALQAIRIDELKDFSSELLQAKLENQKLKLDNETLKMALVKIELALRPPLGREKEVFQAGEIQFNDNVRLLAQRALAEVASKK